jgi:ribonuclease-3
VPKNNEELKKLEEALGYPFRDRALLTLAVTHSSYANEHRKENVHHNERLEFLGDAVLETVTSDFLYNTYPEKQEGDLSRLRASMVCEQTLALCARDFGLSDFLIMGRGEEVNGGRYRDSIVSDALEAVIGAIYLDGGFEAAGRFIYGHILEDIEEKRLFVDSKTMLQEMLQAEEKQMDYVLLHEDGPDHHKSFTVEVDIDGVQAGIGTGSSKKSAEQHAAYAALKKIKGITD